MSQRCDVFIFYLFSCVECVSLNKHHNNCLFYYNQLSCTKVVIPIETVFIYIWEIYYILMGDFWLENKHILQQCLMYWIYNSVSFYNKVFFYVWYNLKCNKLKVFQISQISLRKVNIFIYNINIFRVSFQRNSHAYAAVSK